MIVYATSAGACVGDHRQWWGGARNANKPGGKRQKRKNRLRRDARKKIYACRCVLRQNTQRQGDVACAPSHWYHVWKLPRPPQVKQKNRRRQCGGLLPSLPHADYRLLILYTYIYIYIYMYIYIYIYICIYTVAKYDVLQWENLLLKLCVTHLHLHADSVVWKKW